MNRSTPGLPIHHYLPEFTQTHIHWASDAIQQSHPLSSPSPPAPNLSSIRIFSSESTLRMRWPKYCSFSFSISLSKVHPGLISFKMNWLDLLSVQGTLKSLHIPTKKEVFFFLTMHLAWIKVHDGFIKVFQFFFPRFSLIWHCVHFVSIKTFSTFWALS